MITNYNNNNDNNNEDDDNDDNNNIKQGNNKIGRENEEGGVQILCSALSLNSTLSYLSLSVRNTYYHTPHTPHYYHHYYYN